MPVKLIKVNPEQIKRVKDLVQRNRIEDVCKATGLSTHTVRLIKLGEYDKFLGNKFFVNERIFI